MTDLDDDDLRALLDASFGDGPAHRPLDGTLRDGHRAVRRRRAAAVGGVLAVVLAVGGTGLALSGDGPSRADDGVPPATQAPEPTPDVSFRVSADVGRRELARIVAPGEVEVWRGAEVVRHIDNPAELAPPGWSVALAVRVRGDIVYRYVDTQGNGMEGGGSEGVEGFDAWVAESMGVQEGSSADPMQSPEGEDLVRYGEDGELVLLEGVTLLERVDGPRPRSAAVAVEYDGRVRWIATWTVAGDNGPNDTQTGFFADESPELTFAGFAAAWQQGLGATGGER